MHQAALPSGAEARTRQLYPFLNRTLPPQGAMEQTLEAASQTIESHPRVDRGEGACPRAYKDSGRANLPLDPQGRWQEEVVSAAVLGHQTVKERTPSSYQGKQLDQSGPSAGRSRPLRVHPVSHLTSNPDFRLPCAQTPATVAAGLRDAAGRKGGRAGGGQWEGGAGCSHSTPGVDPIFHV